MSSLPEAWEDLIRPVNKVECVWATIVEETTWPGWGERERVHTGLTPSLGSMSITSQSLTGVTLTFVYFVLVYWMDWLVGIGYVDWMMRTRIVVHGGGGGGVQGSWKRFKERGRGSRSVKEVHGGEGVVEEV